MSILDTRNIKTSEQTIQTPPSPPQGKFQRFCDWIKDHKKEIAIVLLIVAISALCFGLGILISSLIGLGTGASLSSWILSMASVAPKTGAVSLTAFGKVTAAAAGATFGGLLLGGYASGVLAGIPEQEKKT